MSLFFTADITVQRRDFSWTDIQMIDKSFPKFSITSDYKGIRIQVWADTKVSISSTFFSLFDMKRMFNVDSLTEFENSYIERV